MADRVHRVTMFKLPSAEEQQRLLAQYQVLGSTHLKDGKPYILSMVVGPAEADPRSQGYTIVSKTEFASMDDMRFYDDECPAHNQVKLLVRQLGVQGILTVYFQPQAVAAIGA